MARYCVCDECGERFDTEAAEVAFDNQYSPKYLYENFEDTFCYACASLYVERGLVTPMDSFSDEREPDI